MQPQTKTLQQIHLDAEQLRESGDLASAEQAFRQIIAKSPDFHPAYHSLGLLAYSEGKADLAIDLIKHVIALNEKVPLYHSNLCEMCRRAGKLDESIVEGKKAIMLAPNNPNFMYNLALAYAENQNLGSAVECYKDLLLIKPDHGLACNNLGAALEKSGQIDEALIFYEKAVELDPNHAEAQNNLGAIYSELGQLEEANECFSSAIRAKPDFIEPYYNLSSLKTFTINDPELTYLKNLRRENENLSIDEQIRYYFTIGKAFEDIAEYENAFNAYQRGNQLKFSQFNINESQANSVITHIKKIFTKELFFNNKGLGCDDATPIFIVGMPRSGTSLIEQILASHDSIYGAGELVELHKVIINSRSDIRKGRIFNQSEPGLPGFDFQAMAKNYLHEIRNVDSNSKHVTDKMPANFFYIGFIHLMLPNAKIIHSMRDPLDSCVSCYTRLFKDTMDFTYDLTTLGNYYVRYMKLMEHWHKVLPEGKILNVHYEDLVDNMGSQTRKILEHLNLPWDENCLDFYKNKRLVKTASVAQVRQPIYKSSVARWKHFEEQLNPLINIVKKYRT